MFKITAKELLSSAWYAPCPIFPNGKWRVWFMHGRHLPYDGGGKRKFTLVLRLGKKRKLINGQLEPDWEHPRNEKPYAMVGDFIPNNPQRLMKLLGVDGQGLHST
jgi:hypothetical protein